MELRTENCGENCDNCCPSSGVPMACETNPTNCGRLVHTTPSSQYRSSLHHNATPESISGDCGRVIIPISYRSNQDFNECERQNGAIQSVSRDQHQVSSEIFSDRTQLTDDDPGSISLVMPRSNHACGGTSWQMKRKIGDRSSALHRLSRGNCSATVKHIHPATMRKRGSCFKQSLSNKSIVPMDKCSTDSRRFSNSLIHHLTNAEGLTKFRSLNSIHRAESPSHLADLGPSNATCDSEGTTPSHSPHNDDAFACNKVRTFLSVHPSHRSKELCVDGNPALRSSMKPSSMTESGAQREALDIATGQHDRASLLISSSSFPTNHARLETEVSEETSPRNLRAFERIASCKTLVPRTERVRKFRACGRRMLKRRRREYGRLRDMVPSLKALPAVSKVTLIEEAVKYIEELHGALIQRFRDRGLPPTLAGSGLDRSDVGEGNIRDLVVQLLTECNPGCLPPTRLENNRTKLKLQVSRPKVFDRRS